MIVAPYLEQAIILVALFSGIPLLVSTVVSLTAAVLQAATQIQEQSIGFLLKVGSIGFVLWLAGSYGLQKLIDYFQFTYQTLPFLGR